MALVLTVDPADFAGRGNYDSKEGRLMPAMDARGPDGRKVRRRTGGDAWQPEMGKGADLVFRPWEAVVCPSGRSQEDAILLHARSQWGASRSPVRRLDFSGREEPEVMLEYLRRHPEIAPRGEPGTPEHTMAMMRLIARFEGRVVPDGKARHATMRFDDSEEALAAAAAALGSAASPPAGRAFGRSPRKAVDPDAVYEERYAEHRAKGRSEAQAAEFAERSRQAALQAAQPAPAGAAGA